MKTISNFQKTIKVGEKQKQVVIPDGFRLITGETRVRTSDMFVNLMTFKWQNVDMEDVGMFASDFDFVIRPNI